MKEVAMRSNAILGGLLAAALISTAAYTQKAPSGSSPPAEAKATAAIKHAGEWRASKLIGVDVYNSQNEKIGDINEILLTSSGNVAGIVIGVGGFLGVGEHDILVKPDQLKFVNEPRSSDTTASRRDPANTTGARPSSDPASRPARAANEKWYPDHAVMNATKDQIKAMPEFKYSNYN
jgi:sporulation protein YlmC with PRC-barrel domain